MLSDGSEYRVTITDVSSGGFRLQTGETMPTELEALLRAREVERVVVCGLATDYCVKATAIDAARLGFETSLVTDAIAAVDLQPGDGERAIAEMQAAGVALA